MSIESPWLVEVSPLANVPGENPLDKETIGSKTHLAEKGEKTIALEGEGEHPLF